MENISKVTAQCVDAIVNFGAVRATKYIDEKTTAKATRITYRKNHRPRNKVLEIRITVGRPNYLERKFIKLLKEAAEPFPVKKIQLKMPKNA